MFNYLYKWKETKAERKEIEKQEEEDDEGEEKHQRFSLYGFETKNSPHTLPIAHIKIIKKGAHIKQNQTKHPSWGRILTPCAPILCMDENKIIFAEWKTELRSVIVEWNDIKRPYANSVYIKGSATS